MDRGAHFHRCDFQVHSPRDRSWTGNNAVSDEDRRAYASSLIRACRERKLDAIAITDHHDFLFANYVREAAKDERDADGKQLPEKNRVVVFPGLELTLNVPCQALVIFDADLPSDLFSLVLNTLAITPAKDVESKGAEPKRLELITTLNMLRDELDRREFLKSRYIVLPNVTDGGSFTLLRQGNAQKYSSMHCVGGYVDGGLDKYGSGNKNIIDGKASEYGNKRIAVFQTSDNRREDHKKLGACSTWVKWATPTAEALRQACLAQESRISQESPTVPTVAITSLSVSNSQFLGPVSLEFNPQYNALIGGRGTGKSTLLEYLRWGLCDQLPSSSQDEDLPNYQLRRKHLIEKTLQTVEGAVEVGFVINGIPHSVRRNSVTEELLLKVGRGEFQDCKESDVRRLLGIQAFSQKQLSNVSIRLDELTRFVETPIRDKLDEIEKRFQRTSGEMRQVYASLLRVRELKRQVSNDELRLASMQEQAENIRASLTGLKDDDQKVLVAKAEYDDAEAAIEVALSELERTVEIVEEACEALDELPSSLPREDTELPAEDGELPIKDSAKFDAVITTASSHIQSTKVELGKLLKAQRAIISEEGEPKGDLKRVLNTWSGVLDRFNSKYEAATTRAKAHENQLKQLQSLEKQVVEVRQEITKTKRQIKALGSPELEFLRLRGDWQTLHTNRATLLEAECEKLAEGSNGQIRASVRIGAGVGLVTEQFRGVTTGSGLRRERIEAVGRAIEEADTPETKWSEFLAELEALAGIHKADPATRKLPKCPALQECGFTKKDLNRIVDKLDEEGWLELALCRLEDKPVFEYRARERDYIPFANASAGQQATALLKVLLSQPGPPLIIDQPEEDLDNPFIVEVVSQIWDAKKNRQLILASHNANLVVNGDAELVVWCDHLTAGDHSKGHIQGIGAIDVPDICSAIKQVMEGGEAAFKLRLEKYGF